MSQTNPYVKTDLKKTGQSYLLFYAFFVGLQRSLMWENVVSSGLVRTVTTQSGVMTSTVANHCVMTVAFSFSALTTDAELWHNFLLFGGRMKDYLMKVTPKQVRFFLYKVTEKRSG
jgi:hypothetical protein